MNGWPITFGDHFGVDQVLGSQERRQLPEVHLGHEDVVEPPQDVAEIVRERVEVAQVDVRHRRPARRSRPAAPVIAPQVEPHPTSSSAVVVADDLGGRIRLGDLVDAGLAEVDHVGRGSPGRS